MDDTRHFALPPDSLYIATRLAHRVQPRHVVRLIPKPRFSARLGSSRRLYVCAADLEEVRGLPTGEIIRRIYGLLPAGTLHQSDAPGWFNYSRGSHHLQHEMEETWSCEEFYAVVADVERFPEECDLFPGTWKAEAFIVCDPNRMEERMDVYRRFEEIRRGENPFGRMPKETIDFLELPVHPQQIIGSNEGASLSTYDYYGFLSSESGFMDQITPLFGTCNRCWLGSGYIGDSDTLLSRVFLIRNLSLRSQSIADIRLLRRDERLIF